MNRKLYGLGGLGIATALLLSLNVLSNAGLRSKRLDLTEDGLYTLSDGSREMLAKLSDPITLRLYFSRKLAKDYPPLPSYGRRVEELLGEYASRSGGHIRVQIDDPEPFTEVEDEALRYGLKGVPLPGGGGTLYFGLAGTNSVGDVETLPFFQPDKETFLEYDVSRLVYRLAHPDRPTVGVLASLPIEGEMPNPMMGMREMPQPWLFMDQVRQLYETKTLQPNLTEIPPEVDVLLVVHPKALPEPALYAIDQYVLKGGKLLAFVDPLCEADVPPQDPSNPMAAMMAPRSSTLGPLFGAWGVKLVEGQLAGDLDNALQVTAGRSGREEPVSYVLWIAPGKDCMSESEVVTDGLSNLIVKSAGILEPAEGATTEFTPLVRTSADSEQIPVTQVQFGPDPAGLLTTYFSADRAPKEQRFTLAARIGGSAKTAFPNGRPTPAPAEGEEPPPPPSTAEHLAESKGPISVILVADCDLLQDNSWARAVNIAGQRLISKMADNGDLVINALDFLGGSTDLISLRGRGGTARPFTVVEDLKRKAETAYRTEEQRLVDEQQRVEQELNKLLTQQQGSEELLITPEMEKEIAKLRDEQALTHANLRVVRRNLNRDVESLGARLKWLNIALIPLLVGLSAVGLAAARCRRVRGA
jgi:gliding motility-associatede transport system auxiliary component